MARALSPLPPRVGGGSAGSPPAPSMVPATDDEAAAMGEAAATEDQPETAPRRANRSDADTCSYIGTV